MIFNVSNGGNPFAVIGAKYVAGSECTCSNGTITLGNVPSENGRRIFNIPETGDWTVSVSNGVRTRSIPVSITERGQVVSVNANYEAIYIASSDKFTPFAYAVGSTENLWRPAYNDETHSLYVGSIYNLNGAMVMELADADVANFDKISVTGYFSYGAYTNWQFSSKFFVVKKSKMTVGSEAALNSAAVKYYDIPAIHNEGQIERTLELDISDITTLANENYYCGFFSRYNGAVNGGATSKFTEIKLT